MDGKLDKEEKRAVRKGKAYKSFWRFLCFGIVSFIAGTAFFYAFRLQSCDYDLTDGNLEKLFE